MRRFICMGALLALAGCTAADGGPRPSSTNYIEPPAMPTAGPIAPGPNLRVVAPRPAPGVVQRPVRCPAGYHWVKKHRVPGPAGTSRKVPGGCRP